MLKRLKFYLLISLLFVGCKSLTKRHSLKVADQNLLLIKVNAFVDTVNKYNSIIESIGLSKTLKNIDNAKQILLISNTIYEFRDSILFNLVKRDLKKIAIIRNFNSNDDTRTIIDTLAKNYRVEIGPLMGLYFPEFNIYLPPWPNYCSRYYLREIDKETPECKTQ